MVNEKSTPITEVVETQEKILLTLMKLHPTALRWNVMTLFHILHRK
jgi:hypothetical protein